MTFYHSNLNGQYRTFPGDSGTLGPRGIGPIGPGSSGPLGPGGSGPLGPGGIGPIGPGGFVDPLDNLGPYLKDSLGLCRMGNHGLVHKDNHSGNGQRLPGNLGGPLMDSLIRTALTSNALTDVMQTIPTIQQCTPSACFNACNNLG